MEKSGIKKGLRTEIRELQAAEITEEQLDRVSGGMSRIFGGGGLGGGGTVAESKCWQASTSASNPGDPDTAQDWVVD